MTWQIHRGSPYRLAWSTHIAKVCTADAALFLAACAHLTAEAGGPFVRYVTTTSPLWDSLLPWGRRALDRHIEWIFDETASSSDNPHIAVIRNTAYREGRNKHIYHFESDAILEAYTALAYPFIQTTTAISYDPVWWMGPISEWRSNLATTLLSSGVVADISVDTLSAAIDIVLEEIHRDCRSGAVQTVANMRPFLDTWFSRRYADRATSGFKSNMLSYDIAWALMRRVLGLRVLRPSPKLDKKEAYAMLARLQKVLEGAVQQGMGAETYFRTLARWCDRTGTTPTLHLVFNPPGEVLLTQASVLSTGQGG